MGFDPRIFFCLVEKDERTRKPKQYNPSSQSNMNRFPVYDIFQCPLLILFCSFATSPLQQLITNLREQLDTRRSYRSVDQLAEKYVADVVSITIHGSVSEHVSCTQILSLFSILILHLLAVKLSCSWYLHYCS